MPANPTYVLRRHAELYAEILELYGIRAGGQASDITALVAAILVLAEQIPHPKDV